MLLTIAPNEDGRVLKNLLQSRYKMSRRLLRQLVRNNAITNRDDVMYLNQRVHEGDVIKIMLPKENSDLQSEPMSLDIAYEDDQILVLNKPAGVLSHPTAWEREGSSLSGLLDYLSTQQAVPHCVHRLDRDTSGLVMFAKHAHFHHIFDYALQNGMVHRKYLALVHVSPHDTGVEDETHFSNDTAQHEKMEWQTVRLPIAINRNKPSRRVVSLDGQAAVTHYRLVFKVRDIALLELQLETGRTHQIRLHLASIGLPIIGDPFYDWSYCMTPGGQERTVDETEFRRLGSLIGHQALHAFRLQWTHPVTGLTHAVTAPPPPDFARLVQARGSNAADWKSTLEKLLFAQDSLE